MGLYWRVGGMFTCNSSRTMIEAPSAIAKPSRSLSNGREAFSAELPWNFVVKARALQKPATDRGLMQASPAKENHMICDHTEINMCNYQKWKWLTRPGHHDVCRSGFDEVESIADGVGSGGAGRRHAVWRALCIRKDNLISLVKETLTNWILNN